jgi:molybdopterin-containing oxidoreductase family iron-sulfur binding subunit
MEACKVENNTPQSIFWMHVFRFEEGEYPNVRDRFMPRPCMHCENPPCVKACPIKARYQRDDGLVATDWEACKGFRYCAAACPYGVNYFNWDEPRNKYYLDWEKVEELKPITEGAALPYKNPDLDEPYGSEKRRIAGGGHKARVIEKCTFCVQRVEKKGLTTACAAVCPVTAIVFGDLDDPDSTVSRLMREKRAFRLREEYGTRPKVYYLSTAPLAAGSRQIERVGGLR